MQVKSTTEKFNTINIDELEVPAAPKYVETRGFIYIVLDAAFPDYFKIGRTINMKRRLAAYNDDKPFPTTALYAITEMFKDCDEVERAILERMYKKARPTTLSREWFEMDHLEFALTLMREAEVYFVLETLPDTHSVGS